MTAQNLIDTPPRLQYLSQDIVGIKLEPIVALASLRQVGVEVLSVLADTRHSEDFFCHRSAGWSLTLLEAQLAALKNTPHGHNLFINLPITVLTEPASFQRLIRLPCVPLNIELVDLAAFLALSVAQKQRVVQNLQQLSRQPLSGIKIDKEAFWRLRDTPALRQLVSLCFQLAGKVLIEGIETERDRTWALQAGADFGQGYYWPSWTWPED
ncbi:MAG: EAL domain-containing protein [Enterobacter sp.]|uniref:EAL domain-containing protein n=1 Tax=Enterobacter sp. TaxID=42895 RepID=UPI002913C1F6|nr:EAL domain-containing protein [Enterobacter sp.]MDU6060973.1 EAL domain-containing protein [Enterobacter sp.]